MKILSIPQLGRVLLKARKEQGLKQKDVLNRISIGRTTLSRLENGLLDHIDMAVVFELIELYALSLEINPRIKNPRLKQSLNQSDNSSNKKGRHDEK